MLQHREPLDQNELYTNGRPVFSPRGGFAFCVGSIHGKRKIHQLGQTGGNHRGLASMVWEVGAYEYVLVP